MDSSSSSLSSLGQAGATQLLKQILNVGNCDSDTGTANLGLEAKQEISNTSNNMSSEGEISLSSNQLADDNSYNSYSHKGHMLSNGQSHDLHSGNQQLEQTSSATENGNLDNSDTNLQDFLMKMGKQVITKQQIPLTGDDVKNSFSVYGCEVDIISSEAGTSAAPRAGSNKVKISPVVKFDWGHRDYIGKLVAIHRDGTYMAYVTKGKSGGIVRVLNKKTADRAPIRGFNGRVIDIAFAHLSAVLLASVDEMGNMFIHDILEGGDGKITVNLVLQVNRPENTLPSDNHRVIWCPYIPDEDETSGTTENTTADSSVAEDISKLLVLTHDEVAEMWNIDMVTREYGSGPLEVNQITNGYLAINSHTASIVDASFSPDGTALATASLDGKVKFFQVYMHEKGPPRCLHEWKPHDGQPLASLFFLDDHKHPNPQVQFWKFAVTGANSNREIKIWSCESWICLQTIRILPTPELINLQPEPCLKAEMDLASRFLILSDINGKVLYIMQIYSDDTNSRAHISSVSEFLLTQPCLSFAVVDASYRKFPQAVDELESVADLTTGEVREDDEDEELDQKADASNVGILVKLYSVHTRALQELQIRYKAESSVPQIVPSSLSSFALDDTALVDQLWDISMNTTSESSHLMDQSISSPRHEPPSQLPEPASSQETSIMSPSQSAVTDKTSEVSSMTSYQSPSDSARQAVAQADVLLNELMNDPYRDVTPATNSNTSSAGNMLTALKDSGHQRPLLMTPDAFLPSHRRESGAVEDSVKSSGSSSFTQVTAMDDDQLRTPRAPVPHSHTTPESSITLTPASSHDLSAIGSPHTQATPTSLPLPPPTPGEDAALSMERLPSADAIISLGPCSPTHSSGSKMPMPSQANSQEFYTSSPASQKAKDFRPPLKSDSEVQETSSETMDELFHNCVSKPRPILHSTGSSSSTSLEVLEILEGARKHGHDVNNEADAMAESQAGQNDNNVLSDKQSGSEMAFSEDGSGPRTLEHEEHDEEEDDDRSVKYDERIWPKPPDPVQVQAHRMASEAIVRAANMTSGEEDPDVVIEEVQGEQHEGVEVEEEKEQIIEEIHHQEDGGKIIMHTHDRPLPSSTDATVDPARPITVELPSLQELKHSVQQMVHLLQSQQQEIEQLRSEVRIQRETSDTISSLQSHIANLESVLTSSLTGALDQHSQSESQRLQQVLGERETQERLKHDQMVNTLSQTLNKVLSTKLERCVQEEMRKSVLPAVTKLLDPLKHQLHNDIAQKLTATDVIIKTHIEKLIKSKHMIEAIGGSAGNAIQGPIQAACRDVLIPSFDRGCQNVCQQINQTFHRGTQEYIQQLEHHMEQVRRQHEEARDPVVHQLQAMVDVFKRHEEAHDPVYKQLSQTMESLQSSAGVMQTSHSHMETVIKQSLSGLTDSLIEQINKVVEDKVVKLLREQQVTINDQLTTVIRSQAPTPVPTARHPQQIQSEVLMLLKQGQLNAAFQQALSASDLKLVMFVCESVDPVKVFNQTPCPLQQPVLLSLIQQLSADISRNLELKHKYLEEAVMNLDLTDPVTKEHLPAVVGQLCQKLSEHIQKYPHNDNTRQLKMLLRVAQSLLK